ncbi:MAG TPA: DUF2127 domain-containing protein [Acidobacteriaceae bacterium]|nr:DUF2127 domain-containing protein [Acidobacteriaceae bacterium]
MLQAKVSRQEQEERSAHPDDRSADPRRASPEHRRGLLLIGLFKLSKAILSVALGVGALKLLHHDIASVILHISEVLKIDPENRLVGVVMSKADLIGAPQLKHFSVLTFTYAGLCLIEGTGLMLEKRWAEYFTLTLTILALPWECFELYREFTIPRITLLVVNLAVLAYLVWLLRKQLWPERSAPAS